jgi:hypothetical protein
MLMFNECRQRQDQQFNCQADNLAEQGNLLAFPLRAGSWRSTLDLPSLNQSLSTNEALLPTLLRRARHDLLSAQSFDRRKQSTSNSELLGDSIVDGHLSCYPQRSLNSQYETLSLLLQLHLILGMILVPRMKDMSVSPSLPWSVEPVRGRSQKASSTGLAGVNPDLT